MTITGHLSIVSLTMEEYTRVLTEVQANGNFSNVVFDQQTLTISFDLSITE